MDTSRLYSYLVSSIFIILVIFVVVYLSTIQSLSANKFNAVATTTSCVTDTPCIYSDVADFRVIVITYNRAISLSKLLRSLNTLVLDGDRASLEIWIDRHGKYGVDNRTIHIASTFSWKGGPTRVHIQTKPAGIRGQWIDTWRPRDDTDAELGLILEDDISVSPYAYRWLRAVHRAYCHRTDFAGATLQSHSIPILAKRPKGPLEASQNDTVFMYKAVGTWGAAPRPLHWRRFQDWFHQHKPSVAPSFRPYVPVSLATLWYQHFERKRRQSSMWEMWFIYYMHIEQLYGIYSNIGVYTGGKENCLCINRMEVGLHARKKGREDLCRLMTVWKDEYVTFPKNTVRLHWDGSTMGNLLY